LSHGGSVKITLVNDKLAFEFVTDAKEKSEA